MIRINDGKPSVSRRKSSSPQKRVVDALTMVDRVEAKQASRADFTSAPIKIEKLSPPASVTASTSIINRGASENRTLAAPGTDRSSNNPPPKKAPLPTAVTNFPSSYETAVIDQSCYGRATQQKQVDIRELYGNSQTKKVGVPSEAVKGSSLCPPPAPIRKKKISDILPPIMSSGAKKFVDMKQGHGISRGKKMVDIRELYGTKQEYLAPAPPNGPVVPKKKTIKDLTPSTTIKATTLDKVPQAGSSYYAEVEHNEDGKQGCVQADEPKHDTTSGPSLVKCDSNPLSMKKDFPTTSNCIPKKRVRKPDQTGGQPATKKKPSSSSAKKQGDVDGSYQARNVYESDCTSNAASDTGTLPQATNAKQRANICPYKECAQSFARPWRLAAHIRKHKGERPFRCEVEGCSRDYTNPSHLRRHVLRNHSEPGEKLKCPSEGCFMTLASAATLKRHIERRHGPCNFECELCHQKFRKHGELRVHRLTHNPSLDLLYVCTVCNSGFNDKRLHKKHLRTHRTYPCLVTNCNQVFGTWTIFLKHTKNDHPASKYVCAVCSRAFTVKKNLEFHLETHKNSSERIKLTCQFRNCNKFYFQQRNLTAHVKRCHCNDTFDCPYPNCTSKLSTKQKLALHLESVHRIARGSGMHFVELSKKVKPLWDSEILNVKCEVAE